jgi:hypothetical protein
MGIKAKHKQANQEDTNISANLDCIKGALLPYLALLIASKLSRSNAMAATANKKIT